MTYPCQWMNALADAGALTTREQAYPRAGGRLGCCSHDEECEQPIRDLVGLVLHQEMPVVGNKNDAGGGDLVLVALSKGGLEPAVLLATGRGQTSTRWMVSSIWAMSRSSQWAILRKYELGANPRSISVFLDASIAQG